LFDFVVGCVFVVFGFIELDVGFDVGVICICVCFEGEGVDVEWVVDGVKVFIMNFGSDIMSVVMVMVCIGIMDDGCVEILVIMIFFGILGFMVELVYCKFGC